MIKKYVYIFMALFMLVMNWEVQKNETVVASPVTIPEEAIRLRILGNSDAPEDQWLKRKIRDDVVAYMQQLTDEMESIETARRLIADRLPEIKRRVERIVDENGFTYGVDVDFGQVPFPTKLYGNQVYPAGYYEAVRISLGEGDGANWWCVLFPPLCFVDMTNADAVSGDGVQQTAAKDIDRQGEDTSLGTKTGGDELEVRFFLVDWFNSLIDWFTGLIEKILHI